MLPTPNLSHITKQDYEHVYEPAEDTFIFLDALEQDADALRAIEPNICVEVGSGSGCVSAFASKILASSSCLFICTDINPYASRCTLRTADKNKTALEAINASLLAPLTQRLHHSIDILLFNPPYVPTFCEEAAEAQEKKDIAGAWAGGKDGMELTWPILLALDEVLSEKGVCYLVAVKQNDVPGLRWRMREKYAFDSEVVIQRRAGSEYLYVLRFSRSHPSSRKICE